ncbi:hypothetical protein FVEN_g11731 [Fusarium venenatum]|uniref:Uncharacterized protein n=1 Tax=Fusarium venenatum TaxID=56646 RepID=A0A2L2TAC1_9HYPO|nr:uncharacterized protein FVRRES_11143 [Fusarium venenatum]KAG8350145.1 hypothetical protein FVEN_g11731 [Fusarium venenatum]KAH6977868.1 hypothetical protein EDB82DRAFT_502740 [Fusarium venenatum]CEI38452.1 unnamed protein product [Fusarium venenatum]
MANSSYVDFVEHCVYRNPCISGLSQHLKKPANSPSRIFFIDFPADQALQGSSKPISATEQQCVQLTTTIPANVTRLLFIENITPAIIKQIGPSLDIDPLFFSDYVITDFKDLEKQPPPPALAILPSLISEKPYLHLHYQHILSLGSSELFKDSSYALKTDSNVPRNVRRLAPLSGTQLALARASCSIFFKSTGSSSIGLFLVDRPISYVLEASGPKQNLGYQAKALYSGFEDFQPSPPFSYFAGGQTDCGWDKTLMLDSLVHYFSTQRLLGQPSILSLSYYPIRIVLSEWNLYTHLTSRFSKYYEYSLRNMEARLHDEDLVDLQRWRRRCKQSRHKLWLLSEYVSRWGEHESDTHKWISVQKDINYLREQLQDYGQSLEQMVSIATSMVQLLDSRRSIIEAVSVRRLTYIALIFIPLAWVASLFSMSEEFLPGNEHFWAYFAVALPVLGLVLFLSSLRYKRLMHVIRRYWARL